MHRWTTAVVVLGAAAALAGPPKKDPTVNVTGYWVASSVGFYGHLKQTGTTVSGCCGLEHCTERAKCYVRGTWSDDVLLLVALKDDGMSTTCERAVFAAKKQSPTTIVGKWYGYWNGGDGINRESADPGPATEYPVDLELTRCGDVMGYELVFPSSSAELKNPDAALLARLAEMLKKEEKLKLRVVGHTDNTGDAAKNKALSLKRAEAVKKRLMALAGCDAARIATDGLGQESPLQENDSAEGRALNRRVEITVAR